MLPNPIWRAIGELACNLDFETKTENESMSANLIRLYSTWLVVMVVLFASHIRVVDAAVPKKNIIKIHYLKKNYLPDLILTYSKWNSLSREGFGLEYMRRLKRTWTASIGYERLHNSLHTNEQMAGTDIHIDERLKFALDQVTVNLDWQIRRRYYGFTIGGGFGIAHAKTISLHQLDYLYPEVLRINEREEGITTNLIMADRVGMEFYLPSQLKVSALFVELCYHINLKNLKNEVMFIRNDETSHYGDIEIDYMNDYTPGIFYRVGLKFLF